MKPFSFLRNNTVRSAITPFRENYKKIGGGVGGGGVGGGAKFCAHSMNRTQIRFISEKAIDWQKISEEKSKLQKALDEGDVSKIKEILQAGENMPSRAKFTEEGIQLLEKEQYTQCIAKFHEALKIDPEFVEAHVGLGYVYTRLSQLSKAREHFEQAIKIKPQAVDAHNGLAFIYIAERNLYKARLQLFDALEINPNHAPTHSTLGSIFMADKQPDKAMEHFKEAIRIAPKTASQAYAAVGEILAGKLKYKEGAEYLKTALKIDEKYPGPHFSLAAIYCQSGEYHLIPEHVEKAKTLLNERNSLTTVPLTERFSGLGKLFMGNAINLAKETKWKDAELLCKMAIEVEPKKVDYLVFYATCLLQDKKTTEGGKILEEVLELDPNNFQGNILMARALSQIGKLKEAVEFASKAQESNPELAAQFMKLPKQ